MVADARNFPFMNNLPVHIQHEDPVNTLPLDAKDRIARIGSTRFADDNSLRKNRWSADCCLRPKRSP